MHISFLTKVTSVILYMYIQGLEVQLKDFKKIEQEGQANKIQKDELVKVLNIFIL